MYRDDGRGPAVVCTAICEITCTSPSTTFGHPDSISNTAGGGAATITTSSVSTITTPAVTGSTIDLHLLFSKFIKAQKRVMVQAAAAQSLPTLPKFSGEGNQDDDDTVVSVVGTSRSQSEHCSLGGLPKRNSVN